MKINEFLGWSSEQKPLANKSKQPSFEHWLANQERDGAKPYTGDTYYRDHQTQLQQSDLHFGANPTKAHQTPQPLSINERVAFASPKPQETTEYSVPLNSLNESIPNSNTPYSYNETFTPLIKELELAIEQTALPHTPMQNQFTIESQTTKAPQKKPEALPSQELQFKNNQLFIEGNQAELTLNLQQFTKQEQKELITLLHHHLKQKNLNLRQLIINGVTHD